MSEVITLHFSPRGEVKCVRGPSGLGASRLARAGVLEKYIAHGVACATKSWRSYRVLRPSGHERCRLLRFMPAWSGMKIWTADCQVVTKCFSRRHESLETTEGHRKPAFLTRASTVEVRERAVRTSREPLGAPKCGLQSLQKTHVVPFVLLLPYRPHRPRFDLSGGEKCMGFHIRT